MQTVITSFLLASTRGQGVSPPVPVARANSRATFACAANPSDAFRPNLDNCIALGFGKWQQAAKKLLSAQKKERVYEGASPAKWNTMIAFDPMHEFITGDGVNFPISEALDLDEFCAQNPEKKNITKTLHALSSCQEWDVDAAMLIRQESGDLPMNPNLMNFMNPLDIVQGRGLCTSKDKLAKQCRSTKDGGKNNGNKIDRRLAKRFGKYLINLKKVPSKTALKTEVLRSAKECDIDIKRPKPPCTDSPPDRKRTKTKKCPKDNKKKPKDIRCPGQPHSDPGLPGSEF